MDDARAMLASLMGEDRNAGKEERKAKKTKGASFTADSVCKFDLVGFCPEHEDLFHNTKRDLGSCSKTHFEISKIEFEAHPDKKRYQAEYESQLFRHIGTLLRRCDDWGAKEARKNEEKKTENRGGELAAQEIKKLNETASKLLSEAEDLASRGNIAGSKEKIKHSDELKQKALEWEEKANQLPEVCAICGSSKENDAGAERSANYSHEMGKVHQGYALIRKWYAKLKDKEEKGELKYTSPEEDEKAGITRKRKEEDDAAGITRIKRSRSPKREGDKDTDGAAEPDGNGKRRDTGDRRRGDSRSRRPRDDDRSRRGDDDDRRGSRRGGDESRGNGGGGGRSRRDDDDGGDRSRRRRDDDYSRRDDRGGRR